MLTEEERKIIGLDLPLPDIYSTWRHKKSGDIYEIYDITNTHSQKTSKIITISYERLKDHTRWSKYITEWYDDFEPYLNRIS